MKPTDYDMIKLALNSVDLVILRSAGPAGDETQAQRRWAAAGLIDPRPRPAGRIPSRPG